MKVVLTSTCVVILLCGSAFGTRIELFQAEGRNGMAASPTDGLCETMVKPQGYACEEHQVICLPKYFTVSFDEVKGILTTDNDQALAFVLADNEFDVWLANTRGTTYSLGHSSLSPQDKVYWNWSWDELVSDELPAMFQYVYNETGQKLHYVGHSQGSLIALGALSNQQPLNMWKSAALLAPVSYWLDLAKFDPLGAPAITLIAEICVKQGIDCRDLMSAFSGKDCCLNSSGASVLSSHKPQSSATKNLIHFAQMIKEGTLAMYDYKDENENKKHYGQPTPPVYNMTSIPKDFPLFLCHGGADSLSDVKDVKLLINSLKNHVRDRLELHFIDKYAHVDFILGVNAKKVVYDPLIAFFKPVGLRPKLFSAKGHKAALAPAASDDGICASVVEAQNYVCEEHKDAVTWLLLPPEQSLAFLLADNGYDVWLANTRGTKYSRGHVSLSPDDSAFWDWTWDELVAYDLPATLQHVHDQTGQKPHYVGHSLGTLIALASFSKDQPVNKLRSAALLSPIAYVGQMTSPLAKNAADNFLAEALYWLGLDEFDPRGEAVVKLLKNICQKPGVDCTNLLNSFTGQNCCLNSSIVDVFLEHEPQATSTKNMIHVAQMIREGTIAMYDYNNKEENKKHYGQPNPPLYNMTSIPHDLPLFLSYGGADALSDVNDVKLLLESLNDHEGDKLVVQYRQDYAHADYVMGENAGQVLYEPLMAFFKLQ
ncbi:hypothetical protein CUMW_162340 [Citrus unshiu]|nr:hypothetical protein CUMW_162340 [Citrus unshiu]